MQRRILWAVAISMAALVLVAGCINIPKPPPGGYVQLGQSPPPPTPQERQRVANMTEQQLESEVLRLTGENDMLRQQIERLKRDNRKLKDEKQRLEDQLDRRR